MSKYKILFLIFFLITLTGCTATYNLDLSNNNYIEELIIEDKNVTTKELITNMTNNYKKDYSGLFDVNSLSDDNLKLQFKANYYYKEDYTVSKIIKKYTDNFNINKNGNNIAITSKMSYNLMSALSDDPYGGKLLEKLTINIYAPYNVIKHNADNVENNIYTWNYTEKNFNREILLQINTSKESSTSTTTIINNSNNPTTNKYQINLTDIIIIICGIAIILIASTLYKKTKSNDRI